MKTKSITDLADKLPKNSFDKNGRPMEPVNLIVEGSAAQLKGFFKNNGWFLADKLSPISMIKSGLALVFNTSYNSGPFNSGYVAGKAHRYGFEHPTATDNFKRRHHLRLWKTKCKLNGKRIWVGTLSYDRSIIFSKSLFAPVHHINPDLSYEETVMAEICKISLPEFIKISEPQTGFINTGDKYKWNGRALFINLSKHRV